MKVLQINITYPNGSTGKICKDIHEELKLEGIDSKVLYLLGKGENDNNCIRICNPLIQKMQSLRSRITGYAYAGCWYSTKKIIKYLGKEKPDIVHLHCLNGYMVNIYKLLNYLKVNNIKTVLTIHAEFMYTSGCSHAIDCEKWKTGCIKCQELKHHRPHSWFFDKSYKEWCMMKEAYKEYNNLTICCVSDWLRNRALQSPFFNDKNVITISNGLNTNIFNYLYEKEEIDSVLTKYKVEAMNYYLHVTPDFNSEIKGGKYIIELASKMSDKKIVIVGYNDDVRKLPKNVLPIAHTNNQKELAIIYGSALCTLLTSERETFSMVTAESLCCGTPVIGFKAGGPESIALLKYCKFVSFKNVDMLFNELSKYNFNSLSKEQISNKAIEKFNKKKMVKKYLSIYIGE